MRPVGPIEEEFGNMLVKGLLALWIGVAGGFLIWGSLMMAKAVLTKLAGG